MSENNKPLFSNPEVPELCDSIKDNNRILKAVGRFINELDTAKDLNGNGMIIDFKKWGIKVITDDILTKQHHKIHRLKEIYFEEKEKLEDKKIFWH